MAKAAKALFLLAVFALVGSAACGQVDSLPTPTAYAYIESIAAAGEFVPESLFYEVSESLLGMSYGDCTFAWLAVPKGVDPDVFAQAQCERLSRIAETKAKTPSQGEQVRLHGLVRLLVALSVPVVFVLLVILLERITRRITRYLLYQEGRLIKGVAIGKLKVLPARDELVLLINIVRWVRNILIVLLFYGALLFVFHLYPATQQFADQVIAFTVRALKDAALVVLAFLGFAVGAAVLYAVAKVALKIVDIVFRHYEQNPDALRFPTSALLPLRTSVKAFIVAIFVLGYIAVIPGPGGTISMVGLFILLAVVGLSLMPTVKRYIAGYVILFKGLVSKGDRIYYADRWWEVDEVSPLFIRLRSLGKDEEAIIPTDDLLADGFRREKVPKEKGGSDEVDKEG